MLPNIAYFAWFGTLYLIYLTYDDIFKKCLVDDRKNWFMLGLSISLYSHFKHSTYYILFIVFVVIMFGIMMRKYSSVGEADVNSISWVILGLSIINVYSLVLFTLIVSGVTMMYYTIKGPLLKIKSNTAYYPVILVSFITTMALYRLY